MCFRHITQSHDPKQNFKQVPIEHKVFIDKPSYSSYLIVHPFPPKQRQVCVGRKMRRVWTNTYHVQRHWNQRSLFPTNRFIQNPTLQKQNLVHCSPSLAKEFLNQYRIRTCHFFHSKIQSSTIRNFSDNSQKEAITKKRLFVNDAKVSISPDLIGLGIVTFGAFIIMLPRDTFQKIKKSPEVYDEIEVEDDVVNRMNVISKEVRGEITKRILGKDISELDDEGMATNTTADVVADVLNSDALQNAIASLITRVISSAQFQSACQSLLKNLWKDLINDPETTAQVVVLLNTSINDERIKKSFRELVLGLLQDDEIYKELSNIVVRLGEDQEVSLFYRPKSKRCLFSFSS